jgi:hypothetical protein
MYGSTMKFKYELKFCFYFCCCCCWLWWWWRRRELLLNIFLILGSISFSYKTASYSSFLTNPWVGGSGCNWNRIGLTLTTSHTQKKTSIATLYVLIFMTSKVRTAVHGNCRMGAKPDVLCMVGWCPAGHVMAVGKLLLANRFCSVLLPAFDFTGHEGAYGNWGLARYRFGAQAMGVNFVWYTSSGGKSILQSIAANVISKLTAINFECLMLQSI